MEIKLRNLISVVAFTVLVTCHLSPAQAHEVSAQTAPCVVLNETAVKFFNEFAWMPNVLESSSLKKCCVALKKGYTTVSLVDFIQGVQQANILASEQKNAELIKSAQNLLHSLYKVPAEVAQTKGDACCKECEETGECCTPEGKEVFVLVDEAQQTKSGGFRVIYSDFVNPLNPFTGAPDETQTTDFSGNLNVSKDFSVDGSTVFNGDVTLTNVTVNGDTTFNDDVTLEGGTTLTVDGTSVFNDTVTISNGNNFIAGGDVTLKGNVTIQAGKKLLVDEIDPATGGGTITMGGDVEVDGNLMATGSCCPSDGRFKLNQKKIESKDSLEKVLKLVPYTFTFAKSLRSEVNTNQERQRGLMAQEVKSVIPEAVYITGKKLADGTMVKDFHTLDYAKLVVDLIGALQAVNEKHEAAAKKIEELEARLAAVEGK